MNTDEKRKRVTWQRAAVAAVVSDAETEARRTGKTQYVGAIGFPEGSQIYDEATLGYTDDRQLIVGLGTLFATCELSQTIWHA